MPAARPDNRAILQEVPDGLRSADTMVVWKLDRLSRSVVDTGNLLARAQADEWNLVAVDTGLDMTTASGKLVANVLM